MKRFFSNIYNFCLKHRTATTFLVFFSLVFIRYLYFGIKYYLQLDDYGQYCVNYSLSDGWKYIIDIGLLKSRPMAGIGDVFIWSRFFGCMTIALAVISLMFATSALFFESVLNRLFGCSTLFSVIYLLIPINFEGVYWISASSRVVTSLFFVSLTGWLLLRYSDCGKWYYIVFFFISGMLSTAFYEQGLVLSFTYVIMIMICLIPTIKEKNYRPLLALGAIPYCAFYFIFTTMQPESAFYSSRLVLADISSFDNIKYIIKTIGGDIADALFCGSFLTYFKGFIRGIKNIISSPNFIWLAVVIILLMLLFIISHSSKRDNSVNRATTFVKKILFSLIIFAAPLSIFFVIGGTPWFSCRNIVMALPGAALFVDAIADLIFVNKKIAISYVCALFAFGAVIAGVSETADYRQTYFDDQKIINTIITESEDDAMWIFNIKFSYLEDLNYKRNEHIWGITNAAWALTQGCNTYSEKNLFVYPLCIDNGIYYEGWNKKTNKISEETPVYYYDFDSDSLRKLKVVNVSAENNETQAETLELYYSDSGELCGTAVQLETQGTFIPAS